MAPAQAALLIEKEFDVNPVYARQLAHTVKNEDFLEEIARIIARKPKPFVKWVGGKRQLLKQFRDLNLYPPTDFNPIKNTYHEPFVGGGAVFFDLLPRNAVLSDMNEELVTAYRVIQSNVEKLISSLKKHRYEKEYFYEVRAQRPKELSPLETASRFIFLNRTAFNGLYRVNSKGEFNVPFGRYDNPQICDEDNLRRLAVALRDVEIRHEDYANVLSRAKKGDFIYFDPPYYPLSDTSSFTSYTANRFAAEDQIKLRDTFMELHKRGCYVMLSNSSAPFIKKIYGEIRDKGVRITEIQAGRNINSQAKGRGKVKEVLVINYA